MGKPATTKDAQALFHSLRSAYAATPTNLKVSLSLHTLDYGDVQVENAYYTCFLQIIDLYVMFAVVTALIQVL